MTAPAEPDATPERQLDALARASAAAARSGPLPAAVRRWLAALRGRAPDPWSVRPSRRARRAIARSGLFDAEVYRRDPDLAGWSRPPLDHYLRHGFAEGRDPNPLFHTRWYLAQNPDVVRSGVNPLHHYVVAGEGEGRRPNPEFDPAWYARANPDVDPARGVLRHYLRHGRLEGRAPSAGFDPAAYLRANPDVARAGLDPLTHWLEHGREEDRPLRPPPEVAPHAEGASRWDRPCLQFAPGADGAGRYRLGAGEPAYGYVPPRRPADLDARMAALGGRPTFSVVTPVYNVDPELLRRAVRSVEAQWWPCWELILVDDASPREDTRACLRELAGPRVKVEFSAANQGIAGATNAALALATGDYVVFLDNDDELTPDCLWELAQAIARTDADYVYSDEDKIDGDGRYFQPFFKPDWSPDALLSIMYTCHVSCARRSLVEAAGRLRAGFEGAQDYDLVLRLTERARRIEHVPKVLYHWRVLPTSIAGSMDAKPYAVESVRRAKAEALQRRGAAGEVEPSPEMPGQFRIRYAPQGPGRVSIVIPSKNNGPVLRRCLDSIATITAWPDYEVVLVDNGSTDPATLDYVSSLSGRPGFTVLSEPAPFNFSALNNLGVRHATGDHLLFLNDDTEVLQTDWLDRLLGWSQRPHVGAVGAKLLFPDGRVQHCGVVNLRGGPGHAFYRSDPDAPVDFGRNVLEYDWLAVTAACLMVGRDKFERVGGFDESFPIAYNDVDLCFRLVEQGLYNVVCQAVRLVHHESVSRGADEASPEKRARLAREWRRLYARHPQFLARDPFHSPNLHPDDVNFTPDPL